MNPDGVEYKYFRVNMEGHTKTNLKEINDLLEQGWHPVRECPFGGGYGTTASILVLLMRTIKKAEVTLTEVFDEVIY